LQERIYLVTYATASTTVSSDAAQPITSAISIYFICLILQSFGQFSLSVPGSYMI
jgi:hypothetical protein